MLGAASIFFIKILYFVPVAWVLLFTNIMAGNIRTWCASAIGLLTPYWCVGGYYLYTGQAALLYTRLSALWQFGPIADFSSITLPQIASLALVVAITIIGMVHFHRNSYKDKIRTRMLFEIFTTFSLSIFVFIILQPQHIDFLTSMLVVCAAPLAGHFISLTHTRATNITFIILLMAVMGVTAFNLWLS